MACDVILVWLNDLAGRGLLGTRQCLFWWRDGPLLFLDRAGGVQNGKCWNNCWQKGNSKINCFQTRKLSFAERYSWSKIVCTDTTLNWVHRAGVSRAVERILLGWVRAPEALAARGEPGLFYFLLKSTWLSLVLTLRLSGPLRFVRGCGRIAPLPPAYSPVWPTYNLTQYSCQVHVTNLYTQIKNKRVSELSAQSRSFSCISKELIKLV